MTLILCVDDNFGLMFNNRRQSRDSVVVADIIENLEGAPLFVSEYTAKLFENFEASVTADFTKGVCFVEDKYDNSLLENAEKVILYNWGRKYPNDIVMDIDYLKSNFTLSQTTILNGTSHDEITKEIYIR